MKALMTIIVAAVGLCACESTTAPDIYALDTALESSGADGRIVDDRQSEDALYTNES